MRLTSDRRTCVFVFVLQLSVKVANVPNLSAGVTCVFEELTESPGEVLAKGQILCMSPSLRDVPSVTQGYGKKHEMPFKILLKSACDAFLSEIGNNIGGDLIFFYWNMIGS